MTAETSPFIFAWRQLFPLQHRQGADRNSRAEPPRDLNFRIQQGWKVARSLSNDLWFAVAWIAILECLLRYTELTTSVADPWQWQLWFSFKCRSRKLALVKKIPYKGMDEYMEYEIYKWGRIPTIQQCADAKMRRWCYGGSVCRILLHSHREAAELHIHKECIH